MCKYFARPYIIEDLPRLESFLLRARPPERVCDFPSLADLQEMLGDPAIQANTHIWHEKTGAITAYAILDPASATLIFESTPGEDEIVLENEAINWGIARSRGLALVEPLETGCDAFYQERQARLLHAGFSRLPETSLHYECPLDNLPVPILLDGYTIRPLHSKTELDGMVALHRAACGTEQMTIAYRRAMMNSTSYIPEGDLVAIDPQGVLTGYCTCWISQEENILTGRTMGHTDPVGTRPDCRRKGLAKALLVAGLHFLKSRGMDVAALGTSSDNLPARAAFESVGFKIVSSRSRYRFSG